MNTMQLKALEFHDNGYQVAGFSISYTKNSLGQWIKKINYGSTWKDIENQTEGDVVKMFSDERKYNVIAILTGKKSGITVIDIDTDKKTGELKANYKDIPETLTIRTPSNGVHLYYKYSDVPKQGQGIVTEIGEVDVRNDGGLIYAFALWEGENLYVEETSVISLEDAPDYIFASQSPSGSYRHTVLDDLVYVSKNPKFHNRNITLFNYFLTELKQLADSDTFPKILEDTKKVLKEIPTSENENSIKATFNSVRNLVLKDRKDLDRSEIKKEAGKMSQKKTQEYFQRIEEFFIRENDIYVLYKQGENDIIYEYNGKGVYKQCSKTYIKSKISLFLKEKNLYQYNKDNFHNEVYNRLVTYLTSLENRCFDEVSQVVNVKNGYFDIDKKELTPHKKDVFSVNQLNMEYDPNKKEMPLFKKYLEVVEQDSEGLKKMLQELAGYILSEGNSRQAVHFLYGETGNNGKSVFWKILAELIGKDNMSFLKLDSFKKSDDFSLEFLVDKKLNVSDETHRSYVDSPLFTDVTAEGDIMINPKGKKGYTHKVKANFVIVGNFYPKFKDATGMQRRLIILPFKHKITKDEEVIRLEERIAEKELSAIFNWALEGLDRVNKNNCFYLSEHSTTSTEEFEELINPVNDYIKNDCYFDEKVFSTLKELYGDNTFRQETGYNKFIKESGKKSLDFKNFKQDLRVLIDGGKFPSYVEFSKVKKVDGKTIRVVSGIANLEKKRDDDFGDF